MPEKKSAGPRGAFATRSRAVEKAVADVAGAPPQIVDDPRSGAVFLSLVNRLSVLEAAVRAERQARILAVQERGAVVLDNEGAELEIARLQKVILDLNAQLAEAEGHEDPVPPQVELYAILAGLVREMVAAFRRDPNPNEIENFLASSPFQTFGLTILKLEAHVRHVELPPTFRPLPILPLP